jgi:hypothetical protein
LIPPVGPWRRQHHALFTENVAAALGERLQFVAEVCGDHPLSPARQDGVHDFFVKALPVQRGEDGAPAVLHASSCILRQWMG